MLILNDYFILKAGFYVQLNERPFIFQSELQEQQKILLIAL